MRSQGRQDFQRKRISDWAPKDPVKFQVPQAANDDLVVALVKVWGAWAGEKLSQGDERQWRKDLERAREEKEHGKPSSPGLREDGLLPCQAVTVEQVGASVLGVHRAALPAPGTRDYLQLTPYLPRSHDDELRNVIGPVLKGGRSVLAMLTGDSSTGKTRALYEALNDLARTRPLLRPADAHHLLAFIKNGRITTGVVLWLNETQRFLHAAEGEMAAAQLRMVLEKQPGVVAVGTMWQRPYWDELTKPGVPGDPHTQARALLKDGPTRQIPVLGEVSAQDRGRWLDLAQQHDDRRMMHALSAGTTDGRVVQHLSGGPELLDVYLQGPGATFTYSEHALITAALDARRLGHLAPIPAALLADAADSTLSPRHRSPDLDWADHALHALSTGERSDGTRTDIRRTLTPLTALRSRSGSPACYVPTDYLDQHARMYRVGELGAPGLWEALTTHATQPDDLFRLFEAAWQRDLFKQAVQLGRRAVMAGHSAAPSQLVRRITGALDPLDRAALWTATHVELSNQDATAGLMDALHELGLREAVDLLADRAAAHVDATSPNAIDDLLVLLKKVAAQQAIERLVDRIVAHTDLTTDASTLASLALALRDTDAREAVDTLADRAAARADLTDPEAVADVLSTLRHAGARQAVAALADRIASHANLMDPRLIPGLLRMLRQVGAEEALKALLARDPARHVNVTDVVAVSNLVHVLWQVGAEEALKVLLARDPARHVDLADQFAVDHLWWLLEEIGATQASDTMTHRIVAHVDITDSETIYDLLRRLHEMDAQQALNQLLARAPGEQVHLMRTNTHGLYSAGDLMKLLREVGAEQEVTILAQRLATDADLADPEDTVDVLGMLLEVGEQQAINMLVDRAVALPDPDVVVYLPLELWRAGTDVNELAAHLAAHVDLTDAATVGSLWWVLQEVRAEGAQSMLLARDLAAHIDVTRSTDPDSVPRLLASLQAAGARQCADALAKRAAASTDATNLYGVARLLDAMREIGVKLPAQTLARRAAASADLTNSYGIALLLDAMRATEGAEEAVEALLGRDPATHIDVTDSRAAKSIGPLLEALRTAGAEAAADALARRAKSAIPDQQHGPYGRETDGRSATPWTWDDVAFPD